MNTKYTGDEHLSFEQMPTGKLLSDFWYWMSGDMLDCDILNIFARYLVETATGKRVDGKNIVTACSSYLKSYLKRGQLEAPVLNKPNACDDAVCVFCLLDCLNPDAVDPVKLEQWKFFVLRCGDIAAPDTTLDEVKRISIETTFDKLRTVLEARA
jgi:hypothetical protein